MLPEIQEAELVEVVVDDEDIFVHDRADEGVRVEAVGEEVFIYRREVRQDAAQVAVIVGVVVAGQALCVGIIVEDLLDRGGEVKEIVVLPVGLDPCDEVRFGAAVGDVEGVFSGAEDVGVVEGHLGPVAVLLVAGVGPEPVLRAEELLREEHKSDQNENGSADPYGFALFFGFDDAGSRGECGGLGDEDRGGRAVDGAAENLKYEDEGRAEEERQNRVGDVLSAVDVKCNDQYKPGDAGVGVIFPGERVFEENLWIQSGLVADLVLGLRDRVEDLIGEDLAVVEIPGAQHEVVDLGEAERVKCVLHTLVAEGDRVDDGGAAVVEGAVGGVGGILRVQGLGGETEAAGKGEEDEGGDEGEDNAGEVFQNRPAHRDKEQKEEGEDQKGGFYADHGADEGEKAPGEEFGEGEGFIFRMKEGMEKESPAGSGREGGSPGAADEDVVVVGEEEEQDRGEAEADRGAVSSEQDVGEGCEGEQGDRELEIEEDAEVGSVAVYEGEEFTEEAIDVGGAGGVVRADGAGEDVVDDEVVGDFVFLVREEEGEGEVGEV